MKNFTKYIVLVLGVIFLASCRSASKSCGLASNDNDIKTHQINNKEVTKCVTFTIS